MPARYQSKAELMPGAEKYMPGYGKTSSYGNSGQGSPLLDLAQSWQDAQDKANKANDDRYNNIVAGHQDNYNQAIQALDKSGAMQRADVGEVYNNRASDVKASAVSRGLSNTTVRDTMLSGNEKERLKAMNRVEEQLNNQRLGYQTSLKNALLQFMERRDDNAPDFGQLLQMAQLMGAGGVGGNQALQYQGGGGGFAGGGGGGGGQPYAGGGAQFAGMGGGYGGPNGFGNWGGGGGGGGGQGNQGLNLAQQQWALQNQQKQDQQLWNWLNGGNSTAGNASWYTGGNSNQPPAPIEQYGTSYNPSDFGDYGYDVPTGSGYGSSMGSDYGFSYGYDPYTNYDSMNSYDPSQDFYSSIY